MEKGQFKEKYKALSKKPETRAKEKKESNSCPKCGHINEKEACFCEYCGEPLSLKKCPVCQASLALEEDMCEKCGTYLAKEKCSFCGGEMQEEDLFCSSCGSPKKGITCPVCHMHTIFSFCPKCGEPLTKDARKELSFARKEFLYQQMEKMSAELEDIIKVRKESVISGFKDNRKENQEKEKKLKKERENEELRQRFLNLLGTPPKRISDSADHTFEKEKKRLLASPSPEEWERLVKQKQAELQQILDKMQNQPKENPALSRNYSMARKPNCSSLGWKCNYKHAVHAGPYGCACPQKGGKWIVLDKNPDEWVIDKK